ncbi:hypothetical protein B0O99DRAFT_690032 [Bisporella sp. PMI_857]|nr:hypothetical protein B0O99DRAFT_690032 [Bisporella sp. PMI_857]
MVVEILDHLPSMDGIPNEEEATQPATQLYTDPRRLGQGNSGLTDDDLADIYCILHPASVPAYKATALIHQLTPQHTIHAERHVNIRQKAGGANDENNEDNTLADLESQGLVSCDVALRLSANVKNTLEGGFYFGRNASRSDIVLGRDDRIRRVSNVHFRIYLNPHGVIMLEDQSTNGTIVDDVLLRAKDKENGLIRHELSLGSIITLTMTPAEDEIKFIVRIPQRDMETEMRYNANINHYFMRMKPANVERNQRKADEHNARRKAAGLPPDLFATPNPDTGSARLIKEWRGGPKYNKVGTIGKGAFATVYKITDKFDGIPFAAKELEKRRFMKNGVLDVKVDNEMKIMRKIQHPHIVNYIEHIDWDEYLYIIMEYVPYGDLGGRIAKTGPLGEEEVKTLATQLLGALQYLHANQITHRDVKPDNILIHSMDPFQVKLTDFGLSKMVDGEDTFLRTFCGTLLYCAPEVYSEYREYDKNGQRTIRGNERKKLPPQRYGHAVDVWSLAGVLFYTLTGVAPYPAKNQTTYQELLNNIMTKPLDIRPLQMANVSEQGIRFIKSMLHIHPEYRATTDELEQDPWITGAPPSFSMSMDVDDEVDMIEALDGDDPEATIEEVQEGASQLSLHEYEHREIADSEDEQNGSDLTELRQPEIPNSFNISDQVSLGSWADSPRSVPDTHVNPGNPPRLFGEIASGSSTVLPPMPLPRAAFLAPPRPIVTTSPAKPARNHEIHRAARSSSLMGTESMVGHLHMHSPSGGESSMSDDVSVDTRAETFPDAGASLRRAREEVEESDAGSFDAPPKKRLMSARQIDLELPPEVFWDPKNKSTHHADYPPMSASNFEAYQSYAAQQGETFSPGEKIFETTMRSFKASRSPSVEKDDQHHVLKRDERKLDGGAFIAPSIATNVARDRLMPPTAPGTPGGFSSVNPETVTQEVISTPVAVDAQIVAGDKAIIDQPHIRNGFQAPKRVLAKILTTSASVFPISLTVTETVTSWGRGTCNTVRYPNGLEKRVPKYAFRIFLFKPGFYSADGHLPAHVTPGDGRNDVDDDMAFYISTKSSSNIEINGVELPSSDAQNPWLPSKFWGELRNGDIITAPKNGRYFTFKFECYWGRSKASRTPSAKFSILPPSQLVEEIEEASLTQEELLTGQKRPGHMKRASSTSGSVSPTKQTTALSNADDGGVKLNDFIKSSKSSKPAENAAST